MKILQLGKFYPIRGGVEKVMWELTRGLSQRGIDCDMLCAMLPSDKVDAKDVPQSTNTEDGTVIRFNEHGKVICVPAITKKAATMISPRMISYLKRHAYQYDIIHVHHPDPMAALALWRSGYKGRVILHWHSDILSQKFFLWLYRPLQRWLISRAETIVGTTPVYVESSPYLQTVQNKVTYTPIGIEPIRYDEAKVQALRESFPGKKIIFSLGRLVPYKGYEFLVGAMSHLDESYHLVIGGTGPLREKLEAQIRDLELKKRVTLLGYVPDEDVPTWFGACDVFVLSSVMKTEAFGIVQLEAMSCGKPVVATRIPESGVAWVNEDGISGRNVAPEDSPAIANAVSAVCGPDYDNYSKGARMRYQSMFSFDKMINKIIQIYENKN